MSQHFIDTIPQVIGYTRAFMQRSRIKNVIGITFNKDGLWAYNHNFLNHIERTMIQDLNKGDKIIWQQYIGISQPWNS